MNNHAPEYTAGKDVNPKKPISEKQLEANRRNAIKSTGPKTPEGKAACAQNAFRHGLTGQVSVKTDEDRAAHLEFTKAIIADLKPKGALESQIALSIAGGHWRLNRIRASEDNIFAPGHYSPAGDIDVDHPELHAALTTARVSLESSKSLERLTLYEQRIHRALDKDMAKLAELQTKRKTERVAALEEAAKLMQVAEYHEEENPNGSEFSTAEITAHIEREDNLKRHEWHAARTWDPAYPYPQAA